MILWPSREPVRRGSWKTPYVVNWVGDRPFAWVDDGVDDFDVAYFAADHQLVHRVDARTGLTSEDFAALRAWAHGKSGLLLDVSVRLDQRGQRV